MRKKYLSLILSVLIISSLCGCNVTNSAVTADQSSEAEVQDTTDIEAEETNSDEEEDANSATTPEKTNTDEDKDTNPALEGKLGIELVEALNSVGPYPTEADYSELYESIDDAIAEGDLIVELSQEYQDKYKGTLDNKESILAALRELIEEDSLYSKLYRLSGYALLMTSKNLMDADARKIYNLYNQVETEFYNLTAFVDAEIFELPLETRQEIFASPEAEFLGAYSSIYTDPERKSFDEASSQIINTLTSNSFAPQDIYSILYEETPLPSITLPNGEEKELTNEVFDELVYSDYDHDFKIELDDLGGRKFEKTINTFTSLLQTAMQNNVNKASINDYDTFLEYALHKENIEPEIYDKNIESVHGILPDYRKYVDLRKEVIGEEDGITYAEMLDYVISDNETREYDDAVRMVEEALIVYGDDYVKTFDAMLRKAHVDVYTTENKRSGAFETSVNLPDIYSYIDMNYRGTIGDVSTLAHEGGHGMYNNIACENLGANLYKTGEIGIFTQEIASTLNEYILFRHLIDTADNDEDKLLYLDSLITKVNQTIILQTKYSEFEKYCYEKVESGEGLDAEDISEYWYNLEKDYEGDSALVTDGRRYAWSRVPHFYYGYYVYKYSTSATYSGIIANRIFSGDEEIVDEYLDMLALGATYKPSDLLKTIDIDPTQDQVYTEFADFYKQLIDEYESLLIATGRIQR